MIQPTGLSFRPTYAMVGRGCDEKPGEGFVEWFTLPVDLTKPWPMDKDATFSHEAWKDIIERSAKSSSSSERAFAKTADPDKLRGEEDLFKLVHHEDDEESDYMIIAFRQNGPKEIYSNTGYYRPKS